MALAKPVLSFSASSSKIRGRRAIVAMGMTLLATAACGTASDEDVSASDESELVSAAEAKTFWDRFAKDDEDVAKKWASDNGGRAWAGDYLAWKESFRQVALVEMYEATKDPAYLDELAKRIEVVFSLRDDKKNMKDVVRGKVVPAWGRYPDVGRETRTCSTASPRATRASTRRTKDATCPTTARS
jgi:hypothetical protein